jgi:hypothetical protein
MCSGDGLCSESNDWCRRIGLVLQVRRNPTMRVGATRIGLPYPKNPSQRTRPGRRLRRRLRSTRAGTLVIREENLTTATAAVSGERDYFELRLIAGSLLNVGRHGVEERAGGRRRREAESEAGARWTMIPPLFPQAGTPANPHEQTSRAAAPPMRARAMRAACSTDSARPRPVPDALKLIHLGGVKLIHPRCVSGKPTRAGGAVPGSTRDAISIASTSWR